MKLIDLSFQNGYSCVLGNCVNGNTILETECESSSKKLKIKVKLLFITGWLVEHNCCTIVSCPVQQTNRGWIRFCWFAETSSGLCSQFLFQQQLYVLGKTQPGTKLPFNDHKVEHPREASGKHWSVWKRISSLCWSDFWIQLLPQNNTRFSPIPN